MDSFSSIGGLFGAGVPTSDGSKVNVAIRVRPLIEREKSFGAQIHWKVDNNELRQLVCDTDRNSNVYAYDNVFNQETKTKEVYDTVVSPIVNKSLEGFNGTVLCYGQTSSGKTHTLYGSPDDKGIILLFADHLFNRIEADEGKRSYIIKVALLEIYNEKVTDLLDAENSVDLVEIDGYFVPKKLVEITVVNSLGIREAADRIQRQRKVGETNMNKDSSRSHTILRVTIIATASEDVDSETDSFGVMTNQPRATTAVLHFVDLAGSEKQAQTGAEGERFREAININKSLSVLSHVISQLSQQATSDAKVAGALCTNQRNAPKSRFINFRDSNLTRLLKNTLTGEAFISMICNVTLASLDETKSTLTFAKLAKKIQIRPKQNFCINNKDTKELEELYMRKDQELKALQRQLELMKEVAFDKSKFPVVPTTDRRHSLCPGILTRASSSSDKEIRNDGFEFRTPLPKFARFSSTSDTNYKTTEETLRNIQEQVVLNIKHKKALKVESTNTCDQEVQTDRKELCTPEKQKTKTDHSSTPIQSLRLSECLLRDSIETDIKEWQEQKRFLEEEIFSQKQLLEETIKKMNLEKEALENDVIKQMQASDQKLRRREAELREEFETKISQLKQTEEAELKEELVLKDAKEWQEEKRILEEEIASQKQLLEETIKKMNLQKEALESDVSKQLEASNENLRRREAELREEFETQIAQLKQREAELKEELKDAKEWQEEKRIFEEEIVSQKQLLEETIKKMNLQKEALEIDVSKQLEASNENLRRREAELREEFETQISQLKQREAELKEGLKGAKEWQEEKRFLEEEIASQKQLLEETIKKMNLEKEALENEVSKQLEASNENLRRREAELREEFETQISQLKKQREAELKEGLKDAKEWQEEKCFLEEEIVSQKQLLEDTIKKMNLEKEALENDVTKQLEASNENLRRREVELRENFETQISQLKQREAELKEGLKDAKKWQEEKRFLEEEIASQKQLFEETIKKMNLEKEALENDVSKQLEASNENLRRREAELREEFETQISQMIQREADLKEGLKDAKKWQEEKRFLEEEIASQKQLLEETIKKMNLQKEALENDVSKQLEASKENLRRREVELRENFETQISQLKQREAELKEELKNAKEWQEEKRFFEEEIVSQKQLLEETIKKMNLEKGALENDVSKQLEASNENLRRREAELREEFETQISRMIQREAELKEELKGAKEWQEEKRFLEEEIASQKQLFEETIKKMNLEKEALENEVSKQLAASNENLTRREAELREAFETQISQLKQREAELEEELKDAKKWQGEKRFLEEEIASQKQLLEETVKKMNLEKGALETRVSKQLEASNENLRRREAELREEFETQISQLKQREAEVKKELVLKDKAQRALFVNRSTECDLTSDLENDLRKRVALYKNQSITLKRDLLKAESAYSEALSKNKMIQMEGESQLRLLNSRIQELEVSVNKHTSTKDIQCNLMKELIDRSEKGERGLLPSYIPDVAQLKHELKFFKNRKEALEIHVNRCTCTPSDLKTFASKPAPSLGTGQPIKGNYHKPAVVSTSNFYAGRSSDFNRLLKPTSLSNQPKPMKVGLGNSSAPRTITEEKSAHNDEATMKKATVFVGIENSQNVPPADEDLMSDDWFDKMEMLMQKDEEKRKELETEKIPKKPTSQFTTKKEELPVKLDKQVPSSTSGTNMVPVFRTEAFSENVVSKTIEASEDEDEEPWMWIERLNK